MTSRLRLFVAAGSLAFLFAHLGALPRTLDDVDSINFALGVESFDIARHQPHPPGYPVFIAAAKLATGPVHALTEWDRDREAATGLAIVSIVAGALAWPVLVSFWIGAGLRPGLAVLAAGLGVASPLFWFTAGRPMSDAAGLVAALAVIAALVTGLAAERAGAPWPMRRWFWVALAAGLAAGVRSQTIWQTAPVLVWAGVVLLRRGRAADVGWMLGGVAAGVASWFLPMLWASGGWGSYAASLGSQGAEDFRGVEMLWRTPSFALLTTAWTRTFDALWHARWLNQVVLGLALVGLVRGLRENRRLLALIAAAFGPYLVFHLLFHETATTRYALPLAIPVAGLAAYALGWMGLRVATGAVLAIGAAGLVIAAPRLDAQATDGMPVFRAFQDLHRARAAETTPPRLAMHHQVWWGVDRVMQWYRAEWPDGPPPFPGDREWLVLVDAWRRDPTRPVDFLADITRRDLALFDPRTTHRTGRYELPADLRRLIGGNRLDSLEWWRIDPPAWMLSTGWSVNPEIAGVTAADETGPHRRPAEAWLRRDGVPMHVLIGGRYVGDGTAATIEVTLDGAPLDRWDVGPESPWFVRWLETPTLETGGEAYARLSVRVTGGTGGAEPRVPVLLEQFDAAPAGVVMFAFAEGWYEREANPATGLEWRWASDAATLDIRHWKGDITLTLAGESPLRYFDSAPAVVVRAGQAEIARFSPADDFSREIAVPAASLAAAGGRVTIETDRALVPADQGTSPDRRRLALRLFRVDLARR